MYYHLLDYLLSFTGLSIIIYWIIYYHLLDYLLSFTGLSIIGLCIITYWTTVID